MTISETQIYLKTKRYLIHSGWKVFAGQPPSGSDHLPVIEIKDKQNLIKGSLGSFKPDLLAYKDFVLLILELKPSFDMGDYAKILSVLNSQDRQASLWQEIHERRITVENSTYLHSLRDKVKIVGGLGYGGELKEMPGVWHFIVTDTGVKPHQL